MWKARIKDGSNIFSKLTPLRVLNGAKIFASYFYSRLTSKASLWGMPIAVSVEPTTSCNLRCPECPSGLRSFTRPTGMLNLDVFRKVINEVSPYSPYLILYFQGEPYLNKNFLDFVNYASQKKMYVATSTNAHYLTDENAKKTVESGLDRLIISIDGTTQDTYESYRIGGDLSKVIEGTKNIIKWKKQLKSSTPHVIFQYLVVKPNEHQTEDVIRIGKELGVDEVRFKTAQIYDFEHGSPLLPEQEKYSRYRMGKNGFYELKNKLFNHCWKMWHSCVFTWDGKVVPCCFDKDASHPMGNISDVDFKSIWRSEKYNNFRSALLRSRKEIDICQNCTEGTKIWA